MDDNRWFEIPEGDFIFGIYNYCDRWCERCIYTEKCRVYAFEKVVQRKNKTDKHIRTSMEENKVFWENINKIIEETAELIDEEIPLKKEHTLSFASEFEFDEDADDAFTEYEKSRDKAEKHNLSIVSHRYEKAVHFWFEKRKGLLKIDYQPEGRLSLNYPGILDTTILEKLANAVEIIQWYHIQIWVKIQRALTGYFEETESNYLIDEQATKDSDGSMFVALTGIDRSLGAWNYLRQVLEPEGESIKPMIRLLLWLKPEIEKAFPKARKFDWPPK